MIQLGYDYTIVCCYCTNSFVTNQIENHVRKCINDLQSFTNYSNKLLLRPEYEKLFLLISKNEEREKKAQINSPPLSKKYVEEFNFHALKLCREYALMKENSNLSKNNKSLKEWANLIPITIDSFHPTSFATINELFSQHTNLKKSHNNLKNLICFICGRELSFWGYNLHINTCINAFNNDCKISVSNYTSINDLPKPNFNILTEIIKVLEKGAKSYNKSYVEFLINEFNIESQRIYINSHTKEELDMSLKFNFVYLNDFDGKEIIEKNMNKCLNEEIKRKKKKKNSTPLNISCFLCGEMFTTNGYEIHYLSCRDEYLKTDVAKTKPFPEPEELPELLNKIVMGFDVKEELEIYNEKADKIYFEILSQACKKCKRLFNPSAYSKHVKSCKGGTGRKSSMADLDFMKKDEEKPNLRNNNQNVKRSRKMSMDHINNINKDDMKQIKSNIKHYFI
jgi:hypothetical protein